MTMKRDDVKSMRKSIDLLAERTLYVVRARGNFKLQTSGFTRHKCFSVRDFNCV